MQKDTNVDWHQTKGLSLTIITLLLANIISTVWWAATLTKDVDTIKGKTPLLERVIRLETITEIQYKYLNRLNATLDKVNTNMDRIDREQSRRSTTVKKAEKYFNRYSK